MKKCLLLVNRLSGSFREVNAARLKELFCGECEPEIKYIPEDIPTLDFLQYDKVVACGGDGTLNHLLNATLKPQAEIIYCPFGTLNETAKGKLRAGDYSLAKVGRAGENLFSYVLAAGTFTPLGYSVTPKSKQRWRAFAYIARVIKEYRVYDIGARIVADGNLFEGAYTLIMAINSPRCFGFDFNRLYSENSKKMHLLLIKAPETKGFWGKVQIFFPFFRAFFVGFKKPYSSKNMSFFEFETLELSLDKEAVFCADGEKILLPTVFNVATVGLTRPIKVVAKSELR